MGDNLVKVFKAEVYFYFSDRVTVDIKSSFYSETPKQYKYGGEIVWKDSLESIIKTSYGYKIFTLDESKVPELVKLIKERMLKNYEEQISKIEIKRKAILKSLEEDKNEII